LIGLERAAQDWLQAMRSPVGRVESIQAFAEKLGVYIIIKVRLKGAL